MRFGLVLGGHLKLLQLTTSSVVFGVRAQNTVINFNLTAIELMKLSKIIENVAYGRGILYFINHIWSFRISMIKYYGLYNKHLFLPLRKITKTYSKD